MAAEVARLVQDGMTVHLDAGTTLLAMAPALSALSDLTVITNDFTAIGQFMDAENVELARVGARVDVSNRSSVGRRYRVAPLTDFDTMVTDTDLTGAAAEGIRAGGSSLVLAQP
ncbi:hypothetical protein ACIBSR_23685 [Streptomyces sp. NPDC049936]|uniref:hypothetical protein n=1 Tax=Streptomyces sp. NPDC049936 TaxID=3365599 RepID=UPI0037A5EE2D